MIESWIEVPEYESLYKISDQGTVRNRHGKNLKTWFNHKGYEMITLCKESVKKNYSVHRLVAESFIGPRPDGLDVCHGDLGKGCNSLINIRYDTKVENNYDVIRFGSNKNSNKLDCPLGHPLSGDNLKPGKDKLGLNGWRSCLACSRAQSYIRFHPELDIQELSNLYLKYKTINKIKESGKL